MTRDEYLAQLRALLTGRTPPDELERILTYYTEYFDEAGPAGEAPEGLPWMPSASCSARR